ncbi:MAG: DUF2125 domain-containing protein [Alphaproteobacteria bacterium]
MKRIRDLLSGRALFLGLLLALAVSAGTAVYWHYASEALREGIERWVAERRAEGLQAGYSSLVVKGFPFRLRATVRDPVLGRPAGTAGGRDVAWEWRGSELVASFSPWSMSHVDLKLPGTHQITLPTGPNGWTVFATAGRAEGTLGLDDSGVPDSGDFNADDLDLLSDDGTQSVGVAHLKLSGATHEADSVPHQTATFDLSLASKGVELPAEAKLPLGGYIAVLEGQASLMGVLPPGPLLEAATAWRNDGGTIEVHRLHLEWGPLVVEAGGTLALDSNLQPIGALSAIVRGFPETVDALVAGGMVQRADGETAKTVLGLLARAPKGGGPPELTVPLTLQNGWVYVGPVALARVPELNWR